jgi:hypothetical protein
MWKFEQPNELLTVLTGSEESWAIVHIASQRACLGGA